CGGGRPVLQRGQEKRGPRVILGPRWGSGRLASRSEQQYYLVNCLTIFSMFAKRAEMEPRKPTTAATAPAMSLNFVMMPVFSSQSKILEEPVASGFSLLLSLPCSPSELVALSPGFASLPVVEEPATLCWELAAVLVFVSSSATATPWDRATEEAAASAMMVFFTKNPSRPLISRTDCVNEV